MKINSELIAFLINWIIIIFILNAFTAIKYYYCVRHWQFAGIVKLSHHELWIIAKGSVAKWNILQFYDYTAFCGISVCFLASNFYYYYASMETRSFDPVYSTDEHHEVQIWFSAISIIRVFLGTILSTFCLHKVLHNWNLKFRRISMNLKRNQNRLHGTFSILTTVSNITTK